MTKWNDFMQFQSCFIHLSDRLVTNEIYNIKICTLYINNVPVMQKYLSQHWFSHKLQVNPCQHPIVILKDVGHNELSDMIQFMYKGEVGVRHQDLPAFLKLADTLKVKGLATEKMEVCHFRNIKFVLHVNVCIKFKLLFFSIIIC